MKRRDLLLTASALALPSFPAAETPRARRIAVLDTADKAALAERWHVLRRRLRERGHIEGTNLTVEVRSSEGVRERLQPLAEELVASRPDIIVASDSQTARAAMRATKSIPIVFAASADPLAAGLVASLARPGGNVTGSSVRSTDAAGKRIELLREVAPDARRFGYLGDMANPGVVAAYEQTMHAAKALRVSMTKFDAAGEHAIARAFDAMAREGIEGLIVSPVLEAHRRQIAELAARQRLPVMFGIGSYLDAGGLMTYGIDRAVFEHRAADYVHRILQGAKPADLPVEQAQFSLGVNLRAAAAIGVKVPQSVLLRAERVIQ